MMTGSISLWQEQRINTPLGAVRIAPGEELAVVSGWGMQSIPLRATDINQGDRLVYALRRDGERLFLAGEESFLAFLLDFAQGTIVTVRLRDEQTVEGLMGEGFLWIKLVPLDGDELLVLYDHGLLVLDAHFDVRWQKYEFLLTYHLEKVKENTIWLVHNYADDLPALGYRVKDGAEVAS